MSIHVAGDGAAIILGYHEELPKCGVVELGQSETGTRVRTISPQDRPQAEG